VKRRAFALRDRCAAPDLSHPVKHNHTSIVQDAYLTGLRDALHIAEQATTKSDILDALKARIEECDPAPERLTAESAEGHGVKTVRGADQTPTSAPSVNSVVNPSATT
jgi:hypothetical protein